MEALFIIGFIIGVICLFIALDYIESEHGDESWQKYVYALIVFVSFGLFLAGILIVGKREFTQDGYNQGQIDALKGIQTHTINYVYPKGDTIPSDTLYLSNP